MAERLRGNVEVVHILLRAEGTTTVEVTANWVTCNVLVILLLYIEVEVEVKVEVEVEVDTVAWDCKLWLDLTVATVLCEAVILPTLLLLLVPDVDEGRMEVIMGDTEVHDELDSGFLPWLLIEEPVIY